MTSDIAPIPRLGGSTSTGTLKVIALLFMFIDHAGKMLFPHLPEMRLLGRIAFPIYCWCLVVGVSYTRSVPKYLLRLLVIGLVSQPLYMLALNHTWQQPNIFLTLALGLCGLWGMRAKWWGSQVWGPVAALVLAVLTGCDYGWRGVLLILLLYGARETRGAIAAVMAAFCLFWGTSSGNINGYFGVQYVRWLKSPWLDLLQPWLKLQGMAILSLPFLLIPLPRLKMPTWLGYALYPAHLVVLYVLELLL